MSLDQRSLGSPHNPPLRVVFEFLDRSVGGASARAGDPSVTRLHQVHGACVAVVTSSGDCCGTSADASVTSVPGAKLLVRAADCAPVLLVGTAEGAPIAIGVAHAGWRGLADGILPASVGALRSLGATEIRASLFPCIEGSCYEFGSDDLDRVSSILGTTVRATTSAGAVAFDMVAGVRASLRLADVHDLDVSAWKCTACNPELLYSYRARHDEGRLGLVAWLEPS